MLLMPLAIILVSLVVQLVHGSQRIVYVSEPISNDEDLSTSGDGVSNVMCCVCGNCSCNSLDHALANLANNVLINITTDVMLSSLINVSNLENVSIIGHNNPTVKCTRAGGIQFNFCINCIIQDITWDGCGTETEPGIMLRNSSTIVIERCSFQYSKGPAIVLSGVSGHVNISHCLIHSIHYGGHGAAIHYSSSNATYGLQVILVISNCNFTNNKNAKSLVYIENMMSTSNNSITLQNIKFCHNQGVSIYVMNEDVYLFEKVLFQKNTAENGAAIYMKGHSAVIFGKNLDAAFIQNSANSNGGAVFLRDHSSIIFDQNSIATFNDNNANRGTIYSAINCNVTFQAACEVTFSSNSVQADGSGIYSSRGHITFTGNSKVKFINNKVREDSGTIYSRHSHISFEGNSNTLFRSNVAYYGFGGAICSVTNSSISFKKSSTTHFTNNTATEGGAIYTSSSSIHSKESSTTDFTNNTARYNGGVIYSESSPVTFEDISTSSFIKNTARDNGGAILSNQFSEITFQGNSIMKFDGNIADNGATFHFTNSAITFNDTSMTSFHNNIAVYGGAVSANDHSNITITGNSVLSFANNEASQSGGAGYFSYYCNLIMEQDAMVTFDSNKALQGGALYFNNKASFLSKGNSIVFFYNNSAVVGGGSATFLTNSTFTLKDDVTINFSNSHAQYGGAILLDASAIMVNNSNKNSITFTNNVARIVGNSIYQDVADSYNTSYLSDRVLGISTEFIATPPNKLKFYDPAICIDDDNDTQCNSYYVHNIMLGSDIVIPACVFNHYNNSVESVPFFVQSEFNPNYSLSGSKQILIHCDVFKGISIKGNQVLSNSTNVSVSINLNVDYSVGWKWSSATLIVELSECHLGFWQSSNSEQCECYNANNIVLCSGSGSTIKRGYWFGSVMGKPTVTFCPINYCNFTSCCETSNGYYHLSPVRNDQCRSHRSGIACGSCRDGYTLSFDSPECRRFESCTAGQTVLVILLTVTYWIVMVILVFAIMYYKVGIG